MSRSNPLKIEITTTKAVVPTITPSKATPDIMLTTFFDFLEIKYRRAM